MAEETTTEETEEVSELRKAAEGGKAAKAEAALARKELAFVKAGIDTDSKPAKALLAAYDGELDAEAIRAEATEWGLIKAEAPATEEEPAKPDYSEDAKVQSMRDASAGTPAPIEEPTLTAHEKAFKQFLADRDEGRTATDAANRAYGSVIKSAAMGDKTALFNPQEWEAKAAEFGHGAEFAR